MRKMKRVETIDEYLAGLPPEKRNTLQALRRTIVSIVPEAEECISYNLPAFRVNGRVVAGFAAGVKDYSYYPFSGRVLPALADDFEGYTMTKGALHFDTEEHRLSKPLVRKLIKTRMAEER